MSSRVIRRFTATPLSSNRIESLEPRTLLSAALSLAGTQTVLGSVNVRVSIDAATQQSEMSVAVNPANPLNIVAFTHRIGASATMGTYYTFDGGNTWTTKIIDNSVDGFNGTFRFDPTIAFDASGRLYIGYGLDPSGGTRRLVVGRSLDGGVTYAGFSTVKIDGTLDKWAMNTGRDPVTPSQENVYIAYRVTAGAATSVRCATSRDGGVTWPIDTLVPDNAQAGADNATFGMPAVGPNGELYVVWDDQDGQPTSSSIKMAFSADAGATFAADRLISTTPITRGNANGFTPTSGIRYHISAQPDRGILTVPTIAVDRSSGPRRGRIYAAYTTRGTGGGTDNVDVVVRFSDDNGANWSSPVAVHNTTSNTASQFLPWLDVDRHSGAVAVGYYDTRNSPTNQLVELWASASIDGGATWSEAKLASAQSNQSLSNPSRYGGNYLEYIGLAAHDGTLQAIWADNRDAAGNLEVYTARAALDSASAGNVLTITGTGGSDSILVAPSSANSQFLEVKVNGTREFAGLVATIDSIVIDAQGGGDTITVSDVAPAALTINAGAGADLITIQRVGNGSSPITIDSGDGDDHLEVFQSGPGTGSPVRIPVADRFQFLAGGNGAVIEAAPGGATLLITQILQLDSSSRLDLFDNDLIVDYLPSTTSPLSSIEGLIRTARANGAWTGNGLTSTTARNDALRNTTLGAIEASDYKLANGAGATFDGQAIDDGAVLVKYTYYGDTDFNGRVNFDDYVRTDSGFNDHKIGWFNGDFDQNGQVNFDDYVLIDLAFNTQGAVLGRSATAPFRSASGVKEARA
jgi:hypothetical protein